MKHAKTTLPALGAALLIALAACDDKTRVGEVGGGTGKLTLQNVSLGRLVDIYAYQRVDTSVADRRNRFNRKLVLVAEDVVVNSGIETQSLFDAAGQERPDVDYEFRPFDKRIGHEELVILWDNRPGPEAANFTRALDAAQTGLAELPAAYRGQNTQTLPIPIVPRNAAVRLQFDGPITVADSFFAANPSAIQLLEFKGDPRVVDPADAFRVLSYRVIRKEDHIVLDTTVLGGEAEGGLSTPGLPASADSVTANIRVAIPARGGVVSTFYVREDGVSNLNGIDSSGRDAVIRDFRSGNLSDGLAGRLREPEVPMIVGSLAMGITGVDEANHVVTLNKRLNFVPVRGRYPFVDGPLNTEGIPLGPLSVPTTQPLLTGDILTQSIVVEMPDGSFETVALRAEVLQNLEIGTTVGETLGVALVPPTGDSGQGEMLTSVRVRVASVFAGKDSLGREHAFRANALPTGQDCVLRSRYYEEVPMLGASSSVTVSDAAWRHYFVRIDPQPAQSPTPGVNVSPNASLAIEFTKPMDLDQVDNSKNLLVTNKSVQAESFSVQMGTPKRATLRVVPTRLSDLSGDGTVLRLQPPMGFFHLPTQTETYAFHVRLGAGGVTDLGGTTLQIFDRPSSPRASWSVDFSLAASANANLVGWHSWLFESEDEDGTVPGSPDMFGQFRLQDGRLTGAATVRFSRSADNQRLSAISRVLRGECWDAQGDAQIPFDFTVPTAPVPHPGLLYWTPRMSDTINPPFVSPVWDYYQQQPQPVGRVVEPHKSQGSRMQMRYLEDDFGLDYRAPSEFAIDVEQLYWSPFNDEAVLYDVFDRYTLSLAHSNRRPDLRCFLANGACWMDGASMNSGLSFTFAQNPLQGTGLTVVAEDKVYAINPNDAFRNVNNTKYVPYPRFDRSYTWRDSRLVTVDSSGNVIGLGGAQQPTAQPPNDDSTANADSPWITGRPDPEFLLAGLSTWVVDTADFLGTSQRDHDPIALPLLVDFKVFPDQAVNGLAIGGNGFQVAMLGSPSNFANPAGPTPGGYYDATGAGFGGRPAWPALRVHASGGEDLVGGQQILIDPANQLVAQGSNTKDAGMGGPQVPIPYTQNTARSMFVAPPGDGMLNWAHADFVRKVSTVTFGFFDTLQPQRADATVVPNVDEAVGFPDFNAVDQSLRIKDLVVQLDPPQARQPAGTSVVLEMRGVNSFEKDDELYDPLTNDEGFDYTDPIAGDITGRGNLLNVNYACEAYRYSSANFNGAARVGADGLTRYVTEDQIGLIRNQATGLLPRFLNMRIVMTNNVGVTPALSPSLRSMNVVYRMQPSQ